jgi:hypothetical protein
LPEKFTSAPELESDSSPTFTEDSTEASADPKDTNTLEPRLSDGDFNNLRNKNSSRRTRREMPSRSTPELSLMREEALSTESSPNTSRPKTPEPTLDSLFHI